MILSMMAASSRNGAIGKKNGGKDGLPWSRLPADLKAFKEHTSGKPVIMGAATKYLLPRPRVMSFAMRLMANLTDGREGDARDKLMYVLERLAKAS